MKDYDDDIKLWKKTYTNIVENIQEFVDFNIKFGSAFDDIMDMYYSAKDHLTLISWFEKYGLRIDHGYKPYQYSYINLNDYICFIKFGDAKQDKIKGNGYYITWSDDNRQPKDEWLLNISFSTGAYIFGDDYDYQHQIFQDFFNEIKSYKPDYQDTHNNSLYWKLENAKFIFEEFNNILKKYQERNQSEFKQRKIEKLKSELNKLEVK